MSTINTSVSLNSTTTFPSVATVVPKSFDTQNNTFGKIKVGGNVLWKSLSSYPCGTQGAYVFAKAPTTNPDGVGVELWGFEQEFYEGDSYPFATLYPGDTALIPLAPNQFTIVSSTTTGDECTLEYSFSTRGLPFGESEIIAVVEQGSWQYYILDANLGKPTPLINTYVNATTYPFVDDFFYIQDKGYVTIFTDNSNNYKMVTADSYGNSRQSDVFYGYDSYWTGGDDEQVASSVVINYDSGLGNYNNLFVFDGNSTWYHEFPEYEDAIEIYSDYERVSSDGSVLLYGQQVGTSLRDVVLINKGTKHILYTFNTNVENDPEIIFGSQDSNTAIIIPQSSDDGQALGIKVFDTNGNLLNENMFNGDLHNANLYVDGIYTYARGKVLISFYDTTYWYFINYDPLTNTLIGGDLSWKYTRSLYTNYNVFSSSTQNYGGDDAAFHQESIRINLYTSTSNNQANGNSYYYPNSSKPLAVTYVIPGMTEPGFYELYDGLSVTKPYIFYSNVEEGGTRDRITILYTTQPDGGSLKQLTLTPTEQIVDTIVTNLNEYYYFEFRHFNDDYSMYNFYDNTGNTSEKYIIHKLGAGKTNNIVENVTYPTVGGFGYISYYISYGLLLVAQLDTGKLFYFNSANNKLTLFLTSLAICNDIDNYDWEYTMRIRNKADNSYVPEDIAGLSNVLLNPYTGLLYHFSNNALLSSSTTPLPSPLGSWYVGIGNNTYVYLYWNGDTYTVNVYDLSFRLIRTVDTGYDQLDELEYNSLNNTYLGICNNRIIIHMYKNVPIQGWIHFIKMISSTGAVQEIQIPDASYVNFLANDQVFESP